MADGPTYVDPTAGQVEAEVGALAPWAEPYVTAMLSQGQGLLGLPFSPYTGLLAAPASTLQTDAFAGYGSLAVPDFSGLRGSFANISSDLYGKSYTPSYAYTPGSFYTPPEAYTAGIFSDYYTAPEQYGAREFTSQFDRGAVDKYDPRQFATRKFPEAVQEYMSPYIEGVVQPQIAEARRQSEITGEQQASRMARAGAFGGARQAIMEAERERNLQQQVSDITGQGYQRAYEQALQAFTQDEARALQEQQLTEQSRQYAASMGLDVEKVSAQYGLSAEQASEMSKQFAYGQRMTAADLEARYGLEADKAQELADQFSYSQDMAASELAARYNLEGTQLAENASQFAANYGLQALNNALSAYQSEANLLRMGYDLSADRLANILTAGGIQRGIQQDEIEEKLRQFEIETGWPMKTVSVFASLLSGLPVGQTIIDRTEPSTFSQIIGGAGGLLGIIGQLQDILNPEEGP